jgi:predicted  nucleic acid-binding Zn-ribbon protein
VNPNQYRSALNCINNTRKAVIELSNNFLYLMDENKKLKKEIQSLREEIKSLENTIEDCTEYKRKYYS